MVDWPLEHIGEIEVDGAWQRVPTREGSRVTVRRGYSAEGKRTLPKPGECSITIDNRDQEHSPRNPNSGLFGKIGRNTGFRFRVGDAPADPDIELTDTFDRTESNGWGDADTGQTWTIYDPFGVSPATSDYSVSNDLGNLRLDTLDESRNIRNGDVDLADLEATFTVQTDETSISDNTRDAVALQLLARLDSTANDWYAFTVGFRTDSGLPDGEGRRVSASVVLRESAVVTSSTLVQSVPGLLYDPDVLVRVRCQVIGPELRMRVWADGEDEPTIWHSQLYDETLTTGEIGFRGVFSSDGTTTPVTVSVGDLEIFEPVTDDGAVRMRGEIPEWHPSRDLSGADLRIPVKPAGILRRLGIGQDPLKSTLRRHVPLVRPLAYWAMEEGRQGEDRIADATVSRNAGPLSISGFDFAKDSDLVGSDPLPVLIGGDENVDFMVSDSIPGEETGSWSVHMMFRISEDDFPGGSDEKTMLAFTTTGSSARRYVVALLTDSGSPKLKLTIRDIDGAELDSVLVNHDSAVSTGFPGLLDDWRRLRIRVAEDGGDLDFRVDWLNQEGTFFGNGGTLSSTSAGQVDKIATFFGSEAASDNSLKGLAIGHLSVWGVQFHTGYIDDPFVSPAGLRGQSTRAWMRRLHVDADIPLEITGEGAEVLGPYPTGTFLDLLGQAVRTEMGLLSESRTRAELAYRTRETLYNQDADLVLNWAAGEIFKPFKATDDDKNVRNLVTARRREGSEATAELTSGRLSTKQAPDGIGLYNTSVETIVDEDSQLGDQAMWRLHVATVDEMRVTEITLKMGNPRMQGFVSDVLTIDVGDRIQVNNTPAEYGPDGFDLLVLGYRETFAEGVWDITFTCEPYSPYIVATASNIICENFENTSLLITVTDGGDAAWVRDSGEAHTGTYSFKSGGITHDETTDAIVTIPDDATEITFWYKVSSEASFDLFTVLVDASTELTASGEVDWTQSTLDVSDADTVTFRYAKDATTSDGDDAAWIDDVCIISPITQVERVDTGFDLEDITVGSELDADITATATEALVHTPGGRWVSSGGISVTDDDDLPVDVRITPSGGTGGEVVTLTATEDLAWDEFGRSETDTWGDADSGQDWTEVNGAASDRSVDGSEAVITLQASVDTIRFQHLGEDIRDCEIRVRMSVDQVATGASTIPGVLMRWTDTSNFYRARLHFGTSGNMFIAITRDTTAIGDTASVLLPWTYSADDQFELRARLDGHRIRARAWPTGITEPVIWHIDETITVADGQISRGDVGLTASSGAGSTVTDMAISYDNFQVKSPQRCTITRSVNGVSRAWDSGDDVRLAVPPVAPL